MRFKFAHFAFATMLLPIPLQSQVVGGQLSNGIHLKEPSYLGLYSGMPVNDLVAKLKLPAAWRRWCSPATIIAGMDPTPTLNCHVLSEWLGDRLRGTRFMFGLNESATVANTIIVTQAFGTRQQAAQMIDALADEWQRLLPFQQLGSGVCGYHLRYETRTYVAKATVFCKDRRGAWVVGESDPVSSTEVTVHMQLTHGTTRATPDGFVR